MKSKDKKLLHTKKINELSLMLKDAHDALFGLKLQKPQAKSKNTKLKFWKRKEIAMIKTIIKEKEFENAKNI